MGAPQLPAAFFVSSDLTEQTVKLGDGTEHKLLFREASAKTWRRYYWAAAREADAAPEDDSDAFDRAAACLIAESLCNPDGTPAMTIDLARTLKIDVQGSIIKAIREAQKGPKSSSEGATNGSGSSSPSPSAGLSRKRKPRSASPSS